jgi:hypothetical protein
METNKLSGVWIDSKKAVTVVLQGDDSSLEVLASDVEGNVRIEGEGRPEGRFGAQFVDHEQADEARRKDNEQDFVRNVLEKIKDAEHLVIFGPSHMKNQLESAVRDLPAPTPNIRAVETADSMTDNQVAEYVRNFFGKPAPRFKAA